MLVLRVYDRLGAHQKSSLMMTLPFLVSALRCRKAPHLKRLIRERSLRFPTLFDEGDGVTLEPEATSRSRPGQRTTPSRGAPAAVLRLAVGGLFILVMGGSTAYALLKPAAGAAGATPKPINGIRCDLMGQPAVHFHAHLDIFVAGRQVTVPAGIGIPSNGSCFYWIHTHDASGVIHVEAPAGQTNRSFTLGDFLAVWEEGPITSTSVAGMRVGGGQQLTVIVDGRHFTGDPNSIVLTAHERITVEITPPDLLQPDFKFRDGL